MPDGLPLAQLVAALSADGFEVGRFRPVRRAVLDTFDGRLHAAGVRLEVHDGVSCELVVKGPGPASASVAVNGPPSVAGDLPRGPLRDRLAPILGVRALLVRAAVASLEASAVRRDGSAKAVVAVTLYDKLGSLPFSWAAEVQPFAGYPKAASETARLLERLGLASRRGDVLALAAEHAGVDPRGFSGSPRVRLDRAEPAVDGFRRVLANLADAVHANWQGTVDDVDPEFLHELRVAVRRTRSVLALGAQVLPREGRDRFRKEFRWLGDVTTPARDLDVYVLEWPGYVAPLDARSTAALAPILDIIGHRRRGAHVSLSRQLRSDRYETLMAGWRAWLGAAPADLTLERRSLKPLGRVVAGRLAEAQNSVLVRGRAVGPDTPGEELHELRKDAKKLRYLLECFAGVLPAANRKAFVQRLKALQDNLGEYQDTEVHSAELRNLSQEVHAVPGVTAETLLAMGRLTELFEQRRRSARQDFAARFASYDTKATGASLDHMIKALARR